MAISTTTPFSRSELNEPLTFAHTLRRGAAQNPDATVMKCDDDSRTWGELLERSTRVAQGLLGLGAGRGDRVAFLGRNCLEYFEILYGSSLIAAVPIGVNWRLSPHEIRAVLRDAMPSVIFVAAEFLAVLAEPAAGGDAVSAAVVVIGVDEATGTSAVAYEPWLEDHAPRSPEFAMEPDELAMLTYTSGTTGQAKGVMHTVSAVAASFALSDLLEIEQDTIALIATPVFHATAAAAAAMVLSAGGLCVIARDADPDHLLSLIEREQVTLTIVVPTILQMLLEANAFGSHDLSTLRTIIYTASPISPELLTAARHRLPHVRFIQVYGSTETLGVTVLRPEEHAEHADSAGRPMPGVRVRLADPATGEQTADGADGAGEVLVKAPTNMIGYWGRPEETARVLAEDGYIRTGDIATVNRGYLALRDRAKDMIISGGENIYPHEIEEVLIRHPSIAEVAVIGVPSARWGETVMAVVVAASSSDGSADGSSDGSPHGLSETDVIEFARVRLAGYKRPTVVEFVDALPRNASGKVLKTALRERFSGAARSELA